MNPSAPAIAQLVAAKDQRRYKLAALPFPEKVRLVVKLQQMAAPVLRARGLSVAVWNLEQSLTQARQEK